MSGVALAPTGRPWRKQVSKRQDETVPARLTGASRKLMQILVRADSSRFIGKRFGATMGIVGLLGAFGAAGYWLPALIVRLLAR